MLSPALLRDDELDAAYRTASTDLQVQKALQAVGLDPAVIDTKWILTGATGAAQSKSTKFTVF